MNAKKQSTECIFINAALSKTTDDCLLRWSTLYFAPVINSFAIEIEAGLLLSDNSLEAHPLCQVEEFDSGAFNVIGVPDSLRASQDKLKDFFALAQRLVPHVAPIEEHDIEDVINQIAFPSGLVSLKQLKPGDPLWIDNNDLTVEDGGYAHSYKLVNNCRVI